MEYYEYLTEFIFAEDVPEKSDVIFVPGNRYGELAVKAAELYHEGMAPLIVPSGKYTILGGRFEGALSPEEYAGKMYTTESEFFASVMIERGVPESAVWQEREATFTYENAILSRKLLEDRGWYPENGVFRAILVCQAYHARRCLMYYSLVFPQAKISVCPVVTREIGRDNWYQMPDKIDAVLGEVQRCGSQFYDILKGTDKVWKGRK